MRNPKEGTSKVLKERAIQLAKPLEGSDINTNSINTVDFLLAKEHYGIEISYVREVYFLKDFTRLPSAPHFIFGVINVRGEIISIVDLKKVLNLPTTDLSDLNKVIVIYSNDLQFGILADSILGINSIQSKDLLPPFPTLSGIHKTYLKGITKESLIVLDAQNILSDKTMRLYNSDQEG